MTFTSDEQRYMESALCLAEQGKYSAKPNPCVGCVIVKGGYVVGEGWHEKAGKPHAEVHALKQAGTAAKSATVYVTLEPCSHHGRTPPCADALINAGVSRVVVAMQDPNPLVSGKGIKALRDAGIDVSVGLLKEQAVALNKAFCHKMTTGKPFIMSKVAMSLDGKTAMASGESQWITGSAAREDVHRLRAQSDIVLTGVGTILADNPKLTARDGLGDLGVQQPRIVVLDSQLKTPLDAAVFGESSNTTVLTCSGNEHAISALKNVGCNVEVVPADENGQVNLNVVYEWLAAQSINSVMIEAGALLNGAFLQAGLVDELIVYMAPSALGSDARGAFSMPQVSKLSDRVQLNYMGLEELGNDIKLTYNVIRDN
ncbi:MAG: bifunctional diaminohydroxyphosphoribosylaminopyrimidine deaminase/5-amino-6-(5-phosphoribosylamino)uracil reductase RibD [Cycloclasticus sp.]|nr:bifunctional diaminohydroxyphosphoribosylaminopyrimidine deaminase/5-amino-6-(5-phosphoribosylamino)uracil reductase RibD [Cycloclasticus sp.]